VTERSITIDYYDCPAGRWSLRHDYVATCWLPLLGPSCIAVLRLTPMLWLDATPATIDRSELAHMIGLANGSRLADACKRLARYGHSLWDGQRLVVPVAMPSLSPTQLDRVPERIRLAHDSFTVAVAARPLTEPERIARGIGA